MERSTSPNKSIRFQPRTERTAKRRILVASLFPTLPKMQTGYSQCLERYAQECAHVARNNRFREDLISLRQRLEAIPCWVTTSMHEPRSSWSATPRRLACGPPLTSTWNTKAYAPRFMDSSGV